MAKNIVIFMDGTWNKPDEPDDDVSTETNVKNLYDMCINDAKSQVTYYDQGVGSHWYDRIRGGISGRGLSKNIREAYFEICRLYDQGDKVFLFGFSRGAYSARSLGGFVYSCGLIPRERITENTIEEAFEVYREGDHRERLHFKATCIPCPLEMIGVWDTVGALGIPTPFLKKFSDRFLQFHDTKINREIKAAYHAVAIDEQRQTFQPTLWDVTKRHEGQIVEQVWFAGVHSDVGGGYPKKHHSDIAFKWMVDKAVSHGIKIKKDHGYKFQPDCTKKIHDSYKIFFGPKGRRAASATEIHCPKVHASVRDKLQARKSYKPLALVDLKKRTDLTPYRVVE